MGWLKKLGSWVWAILALIGAFALYSILSKNKLQEQIDKIESDIDDLEKDVIKKEEQRTGLLTDAGIFSDEGNELDKEIAEAKKKQINLDDKRKRLRIIFNKYRG